MKGKPRIAHDSLKDEEIDELNQKLELKLKLKFTILDTKLRNLMSSKYIIDLDMKRNEENYLSIEEDHFQHNKYEKLRYQCPISSQSIQLERHSEYP